ncbi:Vacuolar protein sorting-associated protein 37C [Pleurostoma richardsiae]|uniref:Vacuolar protein sorting-associated protein 37C n=1 Tax=Pleurostoma richardsiae TaxID=41990 RepID=A0AA38RVV7_9PEZI|nr:Vacuolar protein sorting-associated protein 37C [Pleurostoma richardsiae]
MDSMYSHTPPAPPPKPGSHEASRMGTPALTQSPRPPPPPPDQHSNLPEAMGGTTAQAQIAQPQSIPDPGDQWLPKFLQDKSKQDLADILSNPTLLNALTHAPGTIHPSLAASHAALQSALSENVELATRLLELEARLGRQREAAQAQLLSAHALERQWRAKQAEMDHALAPSAPASLYQRLAQGVQEQEAVCHALEESFLEGAGGGEAGGGGLATERETLEWVRRYREAKKLYYLRQERKERWDEGRVGGWR